MQSLLILLTLIAIYMPIAQSGKGIFCGGAIQNYNTAIYKAFIHLSSPNGTKPHIGVITAGYPWDFKDVVQCPEDLMPRIKKEYTNYGGESCQGLARATVSIFKYIYEVENVEWIPFSSGNGNKCWDSTFIPKLKEVTGLFFNGGYLWNLLNCFQGTKALSIIKERYFNNELALFVSSATALATSDLPIVDSTSTSWQDFYYGAYYDSLKGGLGLFTHGFLDVHVDVYARQGRLFKLIAENKDKGTVGYGIDANTAMMISDANSTGFKVLGPGGVHVVDLTNAVESTNDDPNHKFNLQNASLSYLRSGDTYNFTTGQVNFPSNKTPLKGKLLSDSPATCSESIFADNSTFVKVTTGLFKSSVSNSAYGVTGIITKFRLDFTKTPSSYAVTYKDKISYRNLRVDISCSDNCSM